MPRKYFGTDGIRGEVGIEPLTDQFFIVLGAAIAKSLFKSSKLKKKIIFGLDTRKSCKKIINLISIGLISEGCEIHSAGIVPTPAIAFYTKHKNYDLGIMVSASHNLYKDNGIKIFDSNGFKISIDDENHIENFVENIQNKNIRYEISETNIKNVSSNAQTEYINFCLDSYKINSVKMSLTLDLANGANYELAPKIFQEAGFNINIYNNKPNGKNINDKCGSTYLKDLPNTVKKDNSEFGISMDGDGDRIVIVNSDGLVLDGDDILYIIIKGRKFLNESVEGVVGTTMTNCALEHYLIKENINFLRTKVGDKYVLEKMLTNNYILGGETSGHILMLNHSTSGDSIIAALQFLYYSDILIKNNKYDLLDKYPQKITNLSIDTDLPENIINIIIKEANEKYLSNEMRIVIRRSGTESCIRIMVEAKTNDIVNNASNDIKEFIKEKINILL